MRAADLARDMLIDLAGPRDWHATKESLIARAATRARLSFRRAKAIIYQEPLRLSADEYLGIERAWQGANAALASLSRMAGDAHVSLGHSPAGDCGEGEGEGRRPDSAARGGPAATSRLGR